MRLRPVQMADAAFIVWLRNQDYVKGRVGDSAFEVVGQRKWLENYFEREGDYYFVVVTLDEMPLGTIGLYGINGRRAEWGRYVIRPEVQAAVPAAVLSFDLAFERLGLRELLARCVSTNLGVHSLLKKYGFRQTEIKSAEATIGGQPVDMLHFILSSEDWVRRRGYFLPLARFVEQRINVWRNAAVKPGA